jgi:hypothetical protein
MDVLIMSGNWMEGRGCSIAWVEFGFLDRGTLLLLSPRLG